MTYLKKMIKERNEALISLDRKKIEAYCKKYGEGEMANLPDPIFWAGVYKAICQIDGAPETVVNKAKTWLADHGMSCSIAGHS